MGDTWIGKVQHSTQEEVLLKCNNTCIGKVQRDVLGDLAGDQGGVIIPADVQLPFLVLQDVRLAVGDHRGVTGGGVGGIAGGTRVAHSADPGVMADAVQLLAFVGGVEINLAVVIEAVYYYVVGGAVRVEHGNGQILELL